MSVKMLAHSLAFAILLGLLLFLPAGTLAWPQAWVFMVLFVGCSEAAGVWLKSGPGSGPISEKSGSGGD